MLNRWYTIFRLLLHFSCVQRIKKKVLSASALDCREKPFLQFLDASELASNHVGALTSGLRLSLRFLSRVLVLRSNPAQLVNFSTVLILVIAQEEISCRKVRTLEINKVIMFLGSCFFLDSADSLFLLAFSLSS